MAKSVYYTADVMYEDRGELRVLTVGGVVSVLPSATAKAISDKVLMDIVAQGEKDFPYTWANRRKIGIRMSDQRQEIMPNIWCDCKESAVPSSNSSELLYSEAAA